MSNTTIVNRVREARQSRPGMTQEQLASLCGVSRQTIIAIETGRYSPSLELAFLLSDALESTIDELFHWEGKKLRRSSSRER
jgi:putative transcriptional regulator